MPVLNDWLTCWWSNGIPVKQGNNWCFFFFFFTKHSQCVIFSSELGTCGVSTLPDIWLLVAPTIYEENDMPFVFLSETMMIFRWTPVRVLWIGEAMSVWQVTAFTHYRCKSAGLMVASTPSVTFHGVYFYWAFWFEIQNRTKLCGGANVANNMQLFIFHDLWEENFLFVIVVSVLFLFKFSRLWAK